VLIVVDALYLFLYKYINIYLYKYALNVKPMSVEKKARHSFIDKEPILFLNLPVVIRSYTKLFFEYFEEKSGV